MDIFLQKKLLIRIVILLTVLNLLLISCFLWKDFFHKPQPKSSPGDIHDVTAILKRELNLSKDQVDQLRDLRSGFLEEEKALEASIKNERDSMNIVMFNRNTDEEKVRSLARNVAENEYKMELLRFEQARKFKSICTTEQLKMFEGLVIEIRDYFRSDNKPVKRR
jgi:Spy/CpxP family protein refolding chaperone